MSTPSGDPPAQAEKDTTYEKILRQTQEAVQNSQYPAVARDAIINLLPQREYVAAPRTATSKSILDEPDFGPFVYQKDPLPAAQSDPDQPLQTERQVRMLYALATLGVPGLANQLYDECEKGRAEGVGDKFGYDLMIADRDDKTHWVTLLLYQLPDKVLASLIQGTLAVDINFDPVVGDFYRKHMKSSKHPGIYQNTAARPLMSTLGSDPRTAGRFLSINEVKELLRICRAYFRDTDPAMNDLIDQQFGGKAGSRQWADKASRKEQGLAWCDAVEEYYCKNPDPTKMDIPCLRALSEVGWSKDIERRIPQHTNNANTTFVFGLINAVTRLRPNQGGFGFPEPMSVSLFPIWEPDLTLARIGEILGSMLTSSYIRWGGYNCKQAGTFGVLPDPNEIVWDTAKQKVVERYKYCNAPDRWESYLVRISALVDRYLAQQTLENKFIKAKDKIRDLRTRTQNLELAFNQLRAKLEESTQRFRKVQDERCEKLNNTTLSSGDDEPLGDLVKRVTKDAESELRVGEDFHRRVRLPNAHSSTAATYRPGPAVAQQPLDDAEEAKVKAKLEDFKRSRDEKWEAFKKRREEPDDEDTDGEDLEGISISDDDEEDLGGIDMSDDEADASVSGPQNHPHREPSVEI
ncbi:MAG: hypothetical protein Q9170_006135 [Blastenia crenularia]